MHCIHYCIPSIHMWSEIKPAPKPKNRNAEYSRVHRFPALLCIQTALLRSSTFCSLFWLFQAERLAPVSGWACPRETLACRSCQSPLSAGHLHCADVDAALFISNLGNRHAHPCLINMPPQRLRWILRVCANKPCKHIPLAIGDRDNLKKLQ